MKHGIPLVLFLLALSLVAGCEAAPAPTATPSPTPAPIATAAPAPSPTPTATPPALGLTLTLLEPQDEVVVTQSLLRVVGQTAPDAVVSVNGRIVLAIDEDGRFTNVVPLAEGPNLVEVIASDLQGNQVNKVLTVIYVP